MSETIEVEVGGLYADLHRRFKEQIGDQYDEQARQNFEEFLHNFNQRIEREMEQQEELTEQAELEFEEEGSE